MPVALPSCSDFVIRHAVAVWIPALIGATILAGAAAWWWLQPSNETLLQQARHALVKRDFERAYQLATRVARRPGADPWAWMVAGEAAARRGTLDDSLACYERVTTGTAELRAAGAFGRGEICLQLGKLTRAEQEFREGLQINPNLAIAQRRLVDLLHLTGRRDQAVPWMLRLIQTPNGTLEDLFHLGDIDHPLAQDPAVWTAIRDPEADPLLVQGAAFQALAENRPQEAQELFERIVQAQAENVAAWAGLGESLLQSSADQMPRWSERLPVVARNNCGVQAVFGQWAEQQRRDAEALGWYAHVLEQRPTSRIAWHRLGSSLSRLGQTSDAELALDRARDLQKVALWLDDLFEHRDHLDLIRRVAEQLAILGRSAESAAWTQYALAVQPNQTWAVQLLSQLQATPIALADSSRQTALAALVNQFARQPIATNSNAQVIAAVPNDISSSIHFIDAAADTGLEFTYFAARDGDKPGARIIETTGGGVGVLDFDADGWPDLYFTQGSRVFPPAADSADRDRLFRNLGGQRWSDVTVAAGIEEIDFGQGIAAGDFDNDGFADLYVANYGVNRLWHNLGDGTFREVTPAAMRDSPVWTSSCAIADLNGDGWPDLFDATYCRGIDVETRRCEKQGVVRSCSPRAFQAEADRLWLSQGDGEWTAATDCGLDLKDGYGLGLVIFRPVPEMPLSIFIANDEVPNYWLINSHRTGEIPQWEDGALLGGLAFEANGQSQACMGVACDDANGDGLPDLFVTNFYHESNTLYLGFSPNVFEDRTRAAQLREPSWNLLGFGTQFVDADLDGWPDLLVANGHIDNLTATGEPFRMPLQCFRNRGGTFYELTAREAGDCFARPALGRGLARFDWNRDGLEDAIIVNQESPAVLLQNDSASTGRTLRLQFRAVTGARDAIGTIVRVTVGNRLLTRQLTAGDGYQASNERQLVIGLADAEHASVQVFWPNGERQELTDLEPGAYVIIQNRSPIRCDASSSQGSESSK